MMDIGSIATTRRFAFDACEIIAPKDALSDPGPMVFGCPRQGCLASRADSCAQADHPGINGRADAGIKLELANRSEKGKRWQVGLATA
jgi:hypothetical protein